MSVPYLMRLNSNDGTRYNLLSWTMFCGGIAFFLFFVTCGSLITPVQRVPHILACFIISGVALVSAVYAVVKLVLFHKVKMSRTRSSNDDERTADSDPAETPQVLSKTDPLPINETIYDTIHPSGNPSFSPPTDSLIGLASGESLRSRSWLYLTSEAASCRFRRSFSFDSSVSSMTPYAYGTFQQPDSTTDSIVVKETSSSSLVDHRSTPVYAVPNKRASRNDLSARSRSGFVEDPDYHLPLDCVSSSSQVESRKGPAPICTRSCLKNTDCYPHLNDGSYASPQQAFSSKNQSQNQLGERLGHVKDSGKYNPLYGASYASSPQISSKNQSKNQQGEISRLDKDSGHTNPLYGASSASSPQISSSKNQSKNQQGERSRLVKDSGHTNPLYGASSASSPQISSSKNQSKNQQGERPRLVKDSGHTNPLYGASSVSYPQISSSKDQYKNQQYRRSGLVEDPGYSNPLYGASCAKSSEMSSSKDPSQNQQGTPSGLVEDPHHYNLSKGASFARKDNSYYDELTDSSPEYYYPLASATGTSSSSFDKTTVIENPFLWPTTYQSSEGISENTVDTPQKEPTKHSKRIKRKKVNSASKQLNRKLQKRHDKKMYLRGMRVRTVTMPQVCVGMCSTYGPREKLKVIFAHRIPSFSSEVSSPDEESYMGPTRV